MLISHLELFAGIGGFRQAAELLSQDFDVSVENIGFSEIDSFATKTYKANFDTTNEIELGDIVSFTANKENIENLPNFNLLTGGFPCQSFSMMGKQRGFNDLRGNVFFQILEIAKIKKPAFILLENVKNIITHNKGETLEIVLNSLKESGYPCIYYDVFDTKNFSLAQTRNRVYIFASRVRLSKDFQFNAKLIQKSFENIVDKSSLVRHSKTFEILEKEVDNKYYLSDIIKPTILADGTKNYRAKSKIDQLVARPLTATMAKMHRASQDNYFSDDFLNSTDKEFYSNYEFTKSELLAKRIRRLTPTEAFLLQGFSKDFVINAQNLGISDTQLYKQAGNAVSVNTVYAILNYLICEKDLFKEL
ncbi:DNA (cytosine-5-)-methyltransferase [Streptococcus suis]|uniref:DNA (cytosine-5-)-methyltransferase n=1 Tax=Streptococcus suis TaxID=1307 RepID=UPI0004090CCC|nr:DNA (cytosine-5-)-methyltransferase [Streptococcus suis]